MLNLMPEYRWNVPWKLVNDFLKITESDGKLKIEITEEIRNYMNNNHNQVRVGNLYLEIKKIKSEYYIQNIVFPFEIGNADEFNE